MIREIILLAVSKKYGKYCVAGVDRYSGKWYRLISNDSDSHYALSEQEIRYSSGELAQKLDIVRVTLWDKAISYFQTENYVIAKRTPWEKLGEVSLECVKEIHPPNQPDYIFYNTCRRLPKEHYMSLPVSEIQSLLLICPSKAIVQIRDSDRGRRIAIKLSYKDREYEPLPVTDFEFIQLCETLKAGEYPMRKASLMLLSVGECYEKDDHHYKLIAGIMQGG
ncbi:MAG: hypothetical protein LHW64_07055 [Candidatus Cloacimonetes bacterium]|jgi:hypothetical protein|nr:hypothetical protein [Candidatus Cloacimonadota bacterium]MCB5287545.1 hypothetical protein [Candidatus Cloacimonadota bacterium]MCK9184096.1 hypothetical protein [Candidatus Cloacimonadota bacterium]MCK9584951.1 hypothetical protein [Candidatus Cloacimonadota bacterium]MDY0229866.1 hypothetical protein [Candidatus Cloacimonadaceae bacterium]